MQETFEQYAARILSNVGDEDPRAILAATPKRLRALVAGAPREALVRAPEGRWTVAQILAHMADAEIVGAWRFRTILALDEVPIQAYDQDAWASAFKYADVEPAESLDLFDANRRATLALVGRVDPARLAHVGIHAERGRESIDRLLRMYAGHDRNHVRQIEGLLGA